MIGDCLMPPLRHSMSCSTTQITSLLTKMPHWIWIYTQSIIPIQSYKERMNQLDLCPFHKDKVSITCWPIFLGSRMIQKELPPHGIGLMICCNLPRCWIAPQHLLVRNSFISAGIQKPFCNWQAGMSSREANDTMHIITTTNKTVYDYKCFKNDDPFIWLSL